jgi:DNA-binding beta-propeller fold protein YncE
MAVLRGQSHPIHLTDAFTYVSDVEFTPDYKYLLATSFNTDELYVIDPATDTVNPGPYPTPFNLRGSSNLLSGAARIAIAPDPTGSNSNVKVYVLLGVANAVAKVDL